MQVLTQKQQQQADFSPIFASMIESFQAADPESFGVILKSELEEIMERVFLLPLAAFPKYYSDWFEKFVASDLFFNYHQFFYEFMKSFFKGSEDPLCRNPEIYLVDLLLLKAKFMRKDFLIEKLKVKQYLQTHMTSVDLESFSHLFYAKPLEAVEEVQKEDLLGIITAVRGKVQLKSQNDKAMLLKNMTAEESRSLIENLTDYILLSGNSTSLDKVLQKQTLAGLR